MNTLLLFLTLSLFIQFLLRSRIFHCQRIELCLLIYILQLESGDSITYVHILIYVLPYDCSFNSIHGQRVLSPAFFQNHHHNICSFLFTPSNYFVYKDFSVVTQVSYTIVLCGLTVRLFVIKGLMF